MSETNGKSLNLDEFFGVEAPIVVKWQNRSHELVRPKGLGPKDLLKLDKLQVKYRALLNIAEEPGTEDREMTEDELEQVGEAIDAILDLVAPTIKADSMPFFAKMKLLAFYNEQVGAEVTDDPKAAEA